MCLQRKFYILRIFFLVVVSQYGNMAFTQLLCHVQLQIGKHRVNVLVFSFEIGEDIMTIKNCTVLDTCDNLRF